MNQPITPEQARAVLEDCLTVVHDPLSRGIAQGTAGGFRMAEIITEEEYLDFLAKIPAEPIAWDSTLDGSGTFIIESGAHQTNPIKEPA